MLPFQKTKTETISFLTRSQGIPCPQNLQHSLLTKVSDQGTLPILSIRPSTPTKPTKHPSSRRAINNFHPHPLIDEERPPRTHRRPLVVALVLDLHGVFGDVLAGSAACEFVFDAAADGDGGAVVGDEGCAVCEREVLAVSGRKGGIG